MFAIITTRWHTRPLSRRAKRRSSAAPGSLRKKYAGIAYPPNMVHSTNHSTTSGDHRKPVLDRPWASELATSVDTPRLDPKERLRVGDRSGEPPAARSTRDRFEPTLALLRTYLREDEVVAVVNSLSCQTKSIIAVMKHKI